MTAAENQNLPVWMNQISPTVLIQICNQLNKDLNRAGFFEQIDEVANPQLLKKQLEAVLQKHLSADSKKITNLLYAVDVPETELTTLLSDQTVELRTALTWLILKRTWQKINIRLSGF
ncbi:MAG: hypothetical protein CVT96_09105 [Bacteroidetes bacterium HGW-Bacteroidetes-13]|jgi:hypothetical protein|nr:MAG: hypothetical protein CVT96_09105 [Bacteroidetes bacterium HGW-Bacteroidetes-13]